MHRQENAVLVRTSMPIAAVFTAHVLRAQGLQWVQGELSVFSERCPAKKGCLNTFSLNRVVAISSYVYGTSEGLRLVCQHKLLEGLKVYKGHQQVQQLFHDLVPTSVQDLQPTVSINLCGD